MKYINELKEFLEKSPTAFHATDNISTRLKNEGFTQLFEGKRWKLNKGGKYFLTRNNSSVVAFKIGKELNKYGFQIAASHSDSPTFKIKENAQLEIISSNYTQLNTEGYGGMLCATWFDKPLSIAGRVIVKEGEHFKTKLINIDRDLVLIPNMAIHMNRAANDGVKYNKQVDMLPLFGGKKTTKDALLNIIAEELGVGTVDIYGSDLFLYNRMPASIWGANSEFISCGRIDNLECAFSSLEGFLKGGNDSSIQVYVCFDNEEVGSGTKQGAGSTLILDVFERINLALGKDAQDLKCALANSFLLSCDNGHAVHPNHPEKTDVNNCSYMNDGVVIKSHAGQKYTSDGLSIAIFKDICKKAGVPIQYFANRSDELGGSTLGNILLAQTSMNAIDIGLAQLAMHSAYETAGVADVEYMVRACEAFFNHYIDEVDDRDLEVVSR